MTFPLCQRITITAPAGLRELKCFREVPAFVRVRDEKPATAAGALACPSFLDSTKFSKPFTLSATSDAADSNAADSAITTFGFILLLSPFILHFTLFILHFTLYLALSP